MSDNIQVTMGASHFKMLNEAPMSSALPLNCPHCSIFEQLQQHTTKWKKEVCGLSDGIIDGNSKGQGKRPESNRDKMKATAREWASEERETDQATGKANWKTMGGGAFTKRRKKKKRLKSRKRQTDLDTEWEEVEELNRQTEVAQTPTWICICRNLQLGR